MLAFTPEEHPSHRSTWSRHCRLLKWLWLHSASHSCLLDYHPLFATCRIWIGKHTHIYIWLGILAWCSLCEKYLDVLADYKINLSQQCDATAKNANVIRGYISRNTALRSVTVLLYSAFVSLPLNIVSISGCQSWRCPTKRHQIENEFGKKWG